MKIEILDLVRKSMVEYLRRLSPEKRKLIAENPNLLNQYRYTRELEGIVKDMIFSEYQDEVQGKISEYVSEEARQREEHKKIIKARYMEQYGEYLEERDNEMPDEVREHKAVEEMMYDELPPDKKEARDIELEVRRELGID